MLFCKLLLSERPHARVRRIDTRRAERCPASARSSPPTMCRTSAAPRALPHQRAAVRRRADPRRRRDERRDRRRSDRAHRARSRAAAPRHRSARQPAARRSQRANRRQRVGTRGRAAAAPDDPGIEVDRGRLRRRRPTAACRWARRPRNGRSAISTPRFKNAALVLDESFVVQSTGHHPMETRSAMAFWQNGKLHLHCSTQSVVRTVDAVARWVGIEPKDVVLICEYTGGGFGSKGGGAVSMAIPALLSKKANAPVMMRISREEESYIGRARTNMAGRVKSRLREGRPDHRARSLHRPGQRAVRADGRSSIGRQRRVADLAAARRCAGARSTC